MDFIRPASKIPRPRCAVWKPRKEVRLRPLDATWEEPERLLPTAGNKHLACLKSSVMHQRYFGVYADLSFEAGLLYRWNLMRKVFRKWKEACWMSRGLWVLQIRAKCHYRTYLLRKYLGLWREFVAVQECDNRKYRLAVAHYNRKLMSSGLNAFKSLLMARKVKLQSRVQTERRLMAKAFEAWHKRVKLKNLKRRISQMLMLRYEQRLKATALRAWRSFVRYRVAMRKLQSVADATYNRNLCRHALNAWKQRVIQSRLELAAKYFQAWHQYVVLKIRRRQQNELATMHYEHKCKVMVIRLLQLNATKHKDRRTLRRKVKSIGRRLVLREFWRRWTKRIEDKEEEGMSGKYAMASMHYRHTTLRNHLSAWLVLTESRRHRRMLFLRAERFRHHMLIVRFMRTWRKRLAEKKYRDNLDCKADYFRCRSLIQCAWYAWQVKLHDRSLAKEKVDMACHFWEMRVKSRFFQRWTCYVQHRQAKRANYAAADALNRRRVTSAVFKFWEIRTTERKWLNAADEVARSHYETKLKRNALRAWLFHHQQWQGLMLKIEFMVVIVAREYKRVVLKEWSEMARKKREEREMLRQAEEFRDDKVARRCLRYWKKWSSQRKEKRRKAQHAIQIVRTHIAKLRLQVAFSTWRTNCNSQVELKMKVAIAIEHRNERLMSRSISVWLAYVEIRRQKAAEKRRAIEFNKANKVRFFVVLWRRKLREKMIWNAKEHTADQHRKHHLLTKVFRAWLQYKQRRDAKRLMYEEILEERRRFLLRECIRAFVAEGLRRRYERELEALRRAAKEAVRQGALVQKYGQIWRFKASQRKRQRLPRQVQQPELNATSYTNVFTDFPCSSSHVQPRIPDFLRGKVGHVFDRGGSDFI